MLNEIFITVALLLMVMAAMSPLVTSDFLTARRISLMLASLAAAVAGAGVIVEGGLHWSANPNAPQLSATIIAFAALSTGVITLALSSSRYASRAHLFSLSALVASAAAAPFLDHAFLPYAPIIAVAALAPSLLGEIEGKRALVLGIFYAVIAAFTCDLQSAQNELSGGTIVWALIVMGVPPLHSYSVRLIQTLPLNVFAGVVVFQVTMLESLLGAIGNETGLLLSTLLAGIALFSGLFAIAQTEARKAVFYIIACQMATAGFAEFGSEEVAIVGSRYLLLTIITASTCIVLLLGGLEARTGRRQTLNKPVGCYESWPRFANAFLIMALISAGLPLTLGYVGSDLIIQGMFHTHPVGTTMILLGAMSCAITMMRMYLYLFQGSAGKQQPSDLRLTELAVTFGFVLITFGLSFTLLP